MQKYFTFETRTDGMKVPNDLWESIRCNNRNYYSECAHTRPEAERKKFIIPVEELDLSCAYNFVSASILGTRKFFRKDLFSVLEPYLVHEFDFGQIKYQDQIVTEGYVLWPKTESIRFRGDKKSVCHRCKYCGKLTYNYNFYNHRQQYVLRQDAEGAIIRPTEYDGLLINEEIYQVLTSHPDWGKFKRKTKLKEVKVEEVPKDGFPVDLNTIKPEEERRP